MILLHKTFWNLLGNYKIEIPTIQRDYVQGSNEAANKKIPNNFVKNLHDTLQGNKTLSLEFIYGYSQENTQDKPQEKTLDKLILLDGQQRITTLFLLHFYLKVVKILSRINGIKDWSREMKLLQNFSYATRSNTRDFCKNLIENPCEYDVKNKEKTLSSQIKNQSWFNFPEDDPTISSMLNMLDIIHEEFNGEDFIDKLTEDNCPITFNFLETKELGYQEDLYLKMNSRGKQLTRYEIFKSRLTTYLTEGTVKEKFERDLDNEYQNILFWKFVENEKDPILRMDNMQCNFFEHVTWLLDESNWNEELNEFFLLNKAENIYKNKPENIIFLRAVLDGFYLFLETYKEKNKTDEKIYNTFKNIINIAQDDKDKKHYYDRLKLYSLLLFFADFFENGENWIDKTKNTKEKTRTWQESDLTQWFRVCHNLIENTLTDDPESFRDGLYSIKQLWSNYITYKKQTQNNSYDFYDYYNPEKISYFNKEQRKEEKLKIEIIKNSLGLSEQDLISHESHPYFKSKIGFILKYSYDTTSGKYSKTKFEEYFEKLGKLFKPTDNEGKETETHSLFRKALLTRGDYLVNIGKRLTFCNFAANPRDKQDTWNKLFDDDNKSKLLKELLDQLHPNEVTDENLQEICNNYINNFNEQQDFYKDWRYLFIKEAKNFFGRDWPELRKIDKNIFCQGPNAKGDWSNKREIYVYAFIKWCESNNKFKWEYQTSSNPYAWIKKEIKGEIYQFHLRYNGSKFEILCFKDNTDKLLNSLKIDPQLFKDLYDDINPKIQEIETELSK